MKRAVAAVALFMVAGFGGCAPTLPPGTLESRSMLQEISVAGGERYLPEEYRNLVETVSQGERSLREDDGEAAANYFRLALEKGELLRQNLAAEKAREAEAARKAEVEQKEKERRLEEERRQALVERQKLAEAQKKAEAARQVAREKPLPTSHTVRRGETLLEIAGRPEIYNDPHLWPLIYRANRDQIKNPAALSGGQVLRIPRNLTREEISEARRFAHDKPLL